MASMTLRSFASDDGAWTLFVRRCEGEDGASFVFSVATARGGFYELRLDRAALESHIEELGVEIKTTAFMELLLTALGVRKCVDVAVDDETASVVLTYKFSETISRKGQLALDCVSTSVPAAVVALLSDVHATAVECVLTESQKHKQQLAAQAKRKASAATSDALSLSQESNQSADGDAAVAPSPVAATAVNPQLLKRRHVPTGTVRRKGPRGAKLTKIE